MAQVQFRDGKRDVPPHLAELMDGIDAYRLTYDEAVDKVNAKLLADHLNKIAGDAVSQHFRDNRSR